MTAKKPLRGPSDPRHGTECGYTYWGCRCQRCREANRQVVAERRNGDVQTHGINGYNMGCRCQTCKASKSEWQRSMAKKKKEWKEVNAPAGKIKKAELSLLA